MGRSVQAGLLLASLACLTLGLPVLALKASGSSVREVVPVDAAVWLITLQSVTGVDSFEVAAVVLVAVGSLGLLAWSLGLRARGRRA